MTNRSHFWPQSAWRVQALLMLAGVAASAQDPTKAYPNNYKLILDNPQVAVIRAHYGPHEKLGVHDHTAFTTVFVYLNDSGEVRLSHEEASHFDVIRPPTHTGAFRLTPGRVERHRIENLGDTPSDFLRVELKTILPGAIKTEFRGQAPTPPLLSTTETVYDNPALRIERTICDPGANCVLKPEDAPSILVAVTPGALIAGGKAQLLTFDQPAAWLPAGTGAGIRSNGPVPVQLLRIVLLSR